MKHKNSIEWPGEPPCPYGKNGEEEYETYQKKQEAFSEGIDRLNQEAIKEK